MMSLKFILSLFVFLNLSASWGSSCFPVGQFSHMGSLNSQAIAFSPWSQPLTITEAQINTPQCKSKTLELGKYRMVQDLASSGEPGLTLLEKTDSKQKSYCLTDVIISNTLFSQEWNIHNDACTKENLFKVVFKDNKKSIYFTKEQLQILSINKPQKVKSKK